jgi:hypothetical protein
VNDPQLRRALFSAAYLQGEAACLGNLAAIADPARRKAHRAEAMHFVHWFGLAQQRSRELGVPAVGDWRLVFTLWQEVLATVPRRRPLWRNLTSTHQLIAGKFEAAADPSEQWRTILLPCSDCGCVFEARRRAGHYRRNCGECSGELVGEGLLVDPHPRSEGLFSLGGVGYVSRLPGSPVPPHRIVEYILCARPGCGSYFSTHRRDKEFCTPRCAGAARQARHRLAAAA